MTHSGFRTQGNREYNSDLPSFLGDFCQRTYQLACPFAQLLRCNDSYFVYFPLGFANESPFSRRFTNAGSYIKGLRGCEKIPGLRRWLPNRDWRRCKSTKVCHDWASCSSLHSPILAQVLTLSRLAGHVWPVFYKSGPRYGRGIFSQPLRRGLARSLSDLGIRSEGKRGCEAIFSRI